MAALPVILIPVLFARSLWILDALVVGFIVLAWVAIHRSLRVGVADALRFFEALLANDAVAGPARPGAFVGLALLLQPRVSRLETVRAQEFLLAILNNALKAR